jgi:beta-phosphoglucomutase-like phosphatase (HAD superfamily)
VLGWLRHHGIESTFACIRTADDVLRTKPAPDLFLSAAACLGLPPNSCLVFEDSPNGILAAHAAGMRCVAVPGAITRRLALPSADLLIESLDALPLADILARVA